jgi:adenylylsulfate kinase-like enzyme
MEWHRATGHRLGAAAVTRADRDAVRALLPPGRFYEVHVDCDVEECRRRDPRKLYTRAARGEVRQLTGVDAPYEAPTAPEIVARTETERVPTILDALLLRLEDDGVLWGAAR